MPGEVEVTRKLVELLDEGKTGTVVGTVAAAIVLFITYESGRVDPPATNQALPDARY